MAMLVITRGYFFNFALTPSRSSFSKNPPKALRLTCVISAEVDRKSGTVKQRRTAVVKLGGNWETVKRSEFKKGRGTSTRYTLW